MSRVLENSACPKFPMDEHGTVRVQCTLLVFMMLVPSIVHAESLDQRLVSNDPEIRLSAQEELRGLDDGAKGALIPPLGRKLYDLDVDVRKHAGFALFQIGVEAMPALSHALETGELATRQVALTAVNHIGSNDWTNPATTDRVIPVLSKALQDSEPGIRFAAARALGEFGPGIRSPAQAASADLLNALNDEDGRVRLSAATTLAKIGVKAPEAIGLLTAALHDDHPYVRSSAAWALGLMGSEAKESVSGLIGMLGDEDVHARIRAAEALEKIGFGKSESVPILLAALKEGHPGIRSNAATTLSRLVGPEDEEVVPALIVALKDEDSNVRLTAALTLGNIGPGASQAVPALADALGDADMSSAPMYIEALERIGSPEALEAIERLK